MVVAVRIGCLADVHGNLPALQAVLGTMPVVDALVCAGDLVGYYADVNEVCAMLRQAGAHVIRGNHDAYVIGELVPDADRRAAYRTDWTRERLSPENRAWLAVLPVELRFRYGTTELVVRHASPWDEETYLYPDSPRLPEIDLQAGEIRLFGHTHHSLWRQCGLGWVLNPGSVGQPRDYNPEPAFAVLDTETQRATLHRAAYDVTSYQRRLRNMGWDEAVVAMLSRKRSRP